MNQRVCGHGADAQSLRAGERTPKTQQPPHPPAVLPPAGSGCLSVTAEINTGIIKQRGNKTQRNQFKLQNGPYGPLVSAVKVLFCIITIPNRKLEVGV